MAFGNLFKGIDLRPGSDDFKAMMGLNANAERSGDRDDDQMVFVSAKAFKTTTGRDISDLLAAMTGQASGSFTATPPATVTPTPTPAPAATAPGSLILNPLLDLDLVPVRPGDLITAASFNALIAACASLHVRLSLLEARGGNTTPTPAPTPGTTPTPPVGKPPNLSEAFLMKRTVAGRETMVLLAKGTSLAGITAATLLMRSALGRPAGSIKLTRWRAAGNTLLFDIAKPSRALLTATARELRVSSPDGEDKVAVEEPSRADRDALEAALLKFEDPLDLLAGKNDLRDAIGKLR